MKVLVLCYEYPPIGGGGGRVAQTVAEALAARGHDVRVQTAALGTRSTEETVGGVRVFRTASLRRAPDTCRVHEMGLFGITSLVPTLRHIWDWQPDVIHVHFAMPTGLLAWAVHRLTGVPYVITAHLGDVPGGVPEQTDKLFALIGPLARCVWHEAAACTSVSTFVEELATKAYRRPVTRILNGIDLSDAPASAPSPQARPHLVFLGRFNPQKRPVYLLEALSRMAAADWTLTMIGDGPVMPDVRAFLAAHPTVAERVQLCGWLKAPEVQGILAKADILCMPSSSEGLPVAAVEALKHGLAIVASDIPGVRDVVTDGLNGFRVPADDLDAYAAKLSTLVENRTQLATMKAASWTKAREFSLPTIIDAYERVLSSAISPQ